MFCLVAIAIFTCSQLGMVTVLLEYINHLTKFLNIYLAKHFLFMLGTFSYAGIY